MTTRPGEIKQWLADIFPNVDLGQLKYIQSDAGDRKYLRLNLSDISFIIMDSKPGADIVNFVKIAEILHQNKVNTPKIIASNLENGLILMTDFGAETYMQALQSTTPDMVSKLYTDAITALINIQSIGATKNIHCLPNMDAEYIDARLNVFKTWYLQKHLQLDIDTDVQLQAISAQLIKLFTNIFQAQPQVFVHLDYHSRNLMYVPQGNNPGILDFQDAMFGPITYDLVSLFQDAYITWPRAQVEAWIQQYGEMALAAGLITNKDAEDLLYHFDLVGLQRHIKNLGVFARLHHRDQKSHYLNDIPTLLKYIHETCNRYPELTNLHKFLQEQSVTVTS